MANFILLPATQTQTNNDTNPKVKDFLTTILEPAVKNISIKPDARMPGKQAKKIPLKVLDSIQEDGAKLVELSNDELADFACHLRIIDDSLFPRTILLELGENDITVIKPEFGKNWSLTPEKEYRVPDTRRKIKKG